MIEKLAILNKDIPLLEEDYNKFKQENDMVLSAKNNDLVSLKSFLEEQENLEFSVALDNYYSVDYIIVDYTNEKIAKYIQEELTLVDFSNLI